MKAIRTAVASTLSCILAASTAGGSDPQSIAGYSVALADFDHDGHLDAFVGRESGGDQVWFGDGHGGFTLHQTVGVVVRGCRGHFGTVVRPERASLCR